MKKGKIRLLLFLMGMCFFTPVAETKAMDRMVTRTINLGESIKPYADTIVKKYRNHNGTIQYRRWNATRGVWVDKTWINVN